MSGTFSAGAGPASANTGGYPDIDAVSCGYSTWCKNGSIYSGRGYAYRNCTDYVAWKLQSLGVSDTKTRGLGNGGEWAVKANGRAGVTVNTLPAYGAAAVIPSTSSNPYGHVAFVEAVNSNGTITISEYNYGWGGTYNQRTATAASMGFTEFVHFADIASPPPPPVDEDPNRGDPTGDGKADLVGISKGSDGTPYINVLKSTNNEFGSPQLWAHPTTGWAEWDTKMWLSGSLGTDGKADLVGISKGGDGTPYINVFPSRGDEFGSPQLWAHPTTGWAEWDTKRWLAGDATGDDKADLVGISKGSDGTPYINVFKSTGESFNAPVLWVHPTTGWAQWDTKRWLLDDFTGDGKADLIGITKASDGTPFIYLFKSTGTSFNAPVLWAHPTTGWAEWDTKMWLSGSLGTDGKADLVGISKGSDGTPYINVFPSQGDEFGAPQLWAHPTIGWEEWDTKAWVVNDYGGDGKADLVGISKAVDGTPYINVFPSRGDEFGAPQLWAHPTTGWSEWDTKVWR